jgi:hypothetical protein
MAELKTKGTHVMVAREWVDQRLGPGTFTKLARSREPEFPELALAIAWYDVHPLVHALTEAAKLLDMPVREITASIAYLNADRDLHTVLRAFMWAAGPVMLLSQSARLWRAYVAFAEARVILNERGRYVGQCHTFPSELSEWVAGAWEGFLPRAIEIAGGSRPSARTLVHDGADTPGHAWLQCEITYG